MRQTKSLGWLLSIVGVAVLAGACGDEDPQTSGATAGGGAGVGAVGAVAGTAGTPITPVVAGTGVGASGTGVAGVGGQAGLPSAGTGTGEFAGTGSTGVAGDVPCDVAKVVENNCGRCHGAEPLGGAISLLTLDDWHQASPVYGPNRLGDPSKRVYEIAQMRINNGEMPQGAQMTPADLSMLDAWLAGGALAAPVNDSCTAIDEPEPVAGTGGDPIVNEPQRPPGEVIDNCTKPGAFDSLVPMAGETCHEFPVHAPGSTGAFSVPTAESYHEWYYAVPWGPTDVWTRFGADFDNLPVLHHYLIFTSAAARLPNDVATNVLGTTLGTAATLIGGWAVGGCNTVMPDDVAGDIPDSPLVMVQWHLYNYTGRTQRDASVVKVCTVPAGTRPNTAGITFLGTENFFGPGGMPPGANEFTTRCTNNSSSPITVIGFNPHMHLLGTHMKTVLEGSGGSNVIFDQPFQFDYQVGYDISPVTMNRGETLVTTCSFFNDTGANVAFGESTNQEMCYQFALSYPAGALNNGTLSLIGALNTCW